MKQKDLAILLGISPANLSGILRCKYNSTENEEKIIKWAEEKQND